MANTQVETHAWQQEGARKRAAVRDLFADIAPVYDRMNGLMTFSLHHRWRRAAVATLKLQKGQRALDVCSGTGDFLPVLRKEIGPDALLVGSDFCAPMLERAKEKDARSALALADACRLPVQDGKFDAVTVGWGIRNVPDIDLAHREIARVLNSGGRFVSLDTARPRNAAIRALSEFLFNTAVPRIGALFGKREAYTYLPKSTQRFWSREELAASMRRAGFVDVGHRDLFFGNICLHFGRKP